MGVWTTNDQKPLNDNIDTGLNSVTNLPFGGKSES